MTQSNFGNVLSFLTSSRYARLCLISFVVHYLDIKFKIEKGSSHKKGTKDKKDKAKGKGQQAVFCSFSYKYLFR